MGAETLRIYKLGSGSYNDIASATAGGFTDLTRTQVFNDAGALDFTLEAVSAAQLASWINEAATVDYFEDGALVESYTVDDYQLTWSTLSCSVKCVGAFASGKTPGPTYLGPLSEGGPTGGNDSVANVLRCALAAGGYDASGNWYPTGWSFAAAKVYTPAGILFEDDFMYSDHLYHGGYWYRTDSPLVAPWYGTGIGVAPYISGGSISTWLSGSQEWSAYTQGFTASANMYVQARVANGPISATMSVGLIARRATATSMYCCMFTPTSIQMMRRSGSSWVNISTARSWTLNNGDIIGFHVVGTSLAAYVNGTYIFSVSDTNITAAGWAGVRGASTTGSAAPSLAAFCVTAGSVPALALGLAYNNTPVADVVQDLCQTAAYRFWLDSGLALNVEPFHTTIDRTYTVNGSLHEFDTTYTKRDIRNNLWIVGNESAAYFGQFSNAASIATYGLRSETLTLGTIVNDAQGAAYANAYFARLAQPRMSMRLLVDHDPTLCPGLLVAVTGLGDGRTYQDLVQQITWNIGDLWDELILGSPPLALAGSTSSAYIAS